MSITAVQPQHLIALEHANTVRSERARLKREVAAGRIELAELIVDPPPAIQSATIYDVLHWLPRSGPAVARRLLAGMCSERRTLARLTNREAVLISTRVSALQQRRRDAALENARRNQRRLELVVLRRAAGVAPALEGSHA